MTYTTSLDESAKKKTAGVTLLFISASFLFFIVYQKQWTLPLIYLGFFVIVLLFTYLLKPVRYEVTDRKFIIHRLIGDVTISRQNISRVDKLEVDLLKNSTKGGVFGYFGKFKTDRGKMTWYGTRRDNAVLITTVDKKNIIVTQDQWDKFIKEFN